MSQSKSRRLYFTVPVGIAEDLERWAEAEKNKPLTLAAFLIEKAVREAKAEGKIPPAPGEEPSFPSYENFVQLVMHNFSKLFESGKFSQDRLKALLNGEAPTEVETLRIALICRVPEDYVNALLNKRGVNGGSHKS